MVGLGIERKPNFIVLNNKIFAKYYLIFRVSDSYSISNLFDFKNKYQLFFRKFIMLFVGAAKMMVATKITFSHKIQIVGVWSI